MPSPTVGKPEPEAASIGPLAGAVYGGAITVTELFPVFAVYTAPVTWLTASA
ncbi:hypothetical protein BH10ACT7_BH10ACT7_25340 [soil metagenome]